MNREEALKLLQLPSSADDRTIRSTLFRQYHQLFSHPSDPSWKTQLLQLSSIRDALSNRRAIPEVLRPAAQVVPPDHIPSYIHVLLYRQHHTETIYTLRIEEQDLVLGFENEFSARKYTRQLSEEEELTPWTECFDTSEILDFCESAGYGVLIIPSDQMIQPPTGC